MSKAVGAAPDGWSAASTCGQAGHGATLLTAG